MPGAGLVLERQASEHTKRHLHLSTFIGRNAKFGYRAVLFKFAVVFFEDKNALTLGVFLCVLKEDAY